MSERKKIIRAKFRASVFDRDGFKCRMCKHKPESVDELDVHHITPRTDIIGGGYIPSNGISVCPICHLRAEQYYREGRDRPFSGYTPEDLYREIGSSAELVFCESKRSVYKSN